MLRRCSILISALLVAALSSDARAVVTVFQDPTNTGTTGAAAASIPIGGAPVALNLYYQTGNTASTPW